MSNLLNHFNEGLRKQAATVGQEVLVKRTGLAVQQGAKRYWIGTLVEKPEVLTTPAKIRTPKGTIVETADWVPVEPGKRARVHELWG